MTTTLIFHMCRADEWDAALIAGAYAGSSQDLADGFIHFSDARQLPGSAAKHRAGQTGLLLLTVAAEGLGPALKWEASRGGQRFPHLHGALLPSQVLRVDPLPLGPDGLHVLPPHVAGGTTESVSGRDRADDRGPA
ncbi:DUF952 domain-containing protein [Oleisolibacter albus]|uniref:DUF952 domain-containing protein n=1 Tax=Oleisolibacter albus TaxID=2171757 RepID=UPI000DF1FE10|nr:DUF952 domain-containing protein [Oleisolibacter albus]